MERARSTGLPSSIVVNDAHSGKSCVARFVCKQAQTCAPGETHRGIKFRLSRRHALGSCKLSRRDIHEYDMAANRKCAQAIETATDTDVALLGVAWCQRVMATTSSLYSLYSLYSERTGGRHSLSSSKEPEREEEPLDT